MDEKQAITRLKQGDPGGLEFLVYTYQLQAIRAACLVTGDRPLAEDIVQSAFIRASERIDQFDAQRPFGPWFLRSVVHDAIKAALRQKRQVPLEQDAGGEPLDLADPAPLPEELVETEETRRAVWRALKKLPPNQRAAIVLRYYLGMSEDEMTDELDSPVGTVKWWLHIARQRLKRLLYPLRPSEPAVITKHQRNPEDDCK
jgi:RNA polymerase sigma-70 factor (ECF subfamily)